MSNPIKTFVNTARIAKILKRSPTLSKEIPTGAKEIGISQLSRPFMQTLASDYLGLMQRPAKRISLLERLGVPKGERNLPIFDDYQKIVPGDQNVFIVSGKDLLHLKEPDLDKPSAFRFEGTLPETGQVYWKDGLLYKRGRKNQYLDETTLDQKPFLLSLKRKPGSNTPFMVTDLRRSLDPNLTDIFELLNDYAGQLPEPDIKLTKFRDNDWFANFKLFYTNLGYNIGKVTPINMLKIIEENYNQLNQGANGLLKGRVFWNGTPDRFKVVKDGEESKLQLVRSGVPEVFEPAPTDGSAVRTSDSDIDGTYFGFKPFNQYSWPTVNKSNLFAEWKRSGMKPGLYTDSKGIPIGRADMQPYMISGVETIFKELPSRVKVIPKNAALIPDRFKGNRSDMDYIEGDPDELTVPIGTPVKSLFPHPDAFIKNADGTIRLVRDWRDARLHFKKGGKL